MGEKDCDCQKVFSGEGFDWGFQYLVGARPNRKSCALTFGADFLLVDGADVNGLRHSPERGGIVPAEEAAVVLLREAPAVEGPGVVAEALKDRSLSARNFHHQSSAVMWCKQMDHFLIIRPKQKLT